MSSAVFSFVQPAVYPVTGVRHGLNPRRIQAIFLNGSVYPIAIESAVRLIDDRKWDLYVETPGGGRVQVHTVHPINEGPDRPPYLSTAADGIGQNNLEALPEQ